MAGNKGEGKTLNITVMRNSRPNHKEHADSNIVKKQILKLNNQANNSVEETRDGSIIFVHNTNATGSKQGRKNTVERVNTTSSSKNQYGQCSSKRVPSPSLTNSIEGI